MRVSVILPPVVHCDDPPPPPPLVSLFTLQDPDSLERCIHTTLSALYPPCQSTSSTLRRQVLCVAERCYRGDALRCIFHFLLPAKQLLAELQRDARVSTGRAACYHRLLRRRGGLPSTRK